MHEASIVRRLRASGSVFAEDEARLLVGEAGSDAALEQMVARRVGGEPLEYIVGWAEFRGLRVGVEAPVFVPRRRTELLADEAVLRVRRWRAGAGAGEGEATVVVELCCGAAAIAAVVLAELGAGGRGDGGAGAGGPGDGRQAGLRVFAADIDPAAVRVARRNLGGGATVLEGDLYDALPAGLRGTVAVIAANAPYVPTGALHTMPPEARLYEATIALDGGGDGLDVHRRLAEHASAWLAPGGCLIVEASERQAPVTAGIFAAAGLVAGIRSSDDLDATIVVGTRAE